MIALSRVPRRSWLFLAAVAIALTGAWVTAEAAASDGRTAVLPEPSSAMLLIAALLAGALRLRLRR